MVARSVEEKRARWTLDVPFYDGRCEANVSPRREWSYSYEGRCRLPAAAVDASGHAVCRVHALKDSSGGSYDEGAARFRFGDPAKQRAIPEDRWDF